MNADSSDQTERWAQRIIKRFEAVERIFPDPAWMKGDWPYWVQRVAQEIAKSSYPTAHFKVGRKWEIGEVAALIGQDIAYFESWLKWCETVKIGEKEWDELKKIFGDEIEERAAEYERKLTQEFFPAFLKAVKFSVSLATEQEYVQMSQFFRAFTKAIQRRPITVGDIGRTNTRVYWVLLISWRRVEEFGSIPELHRRLQRCVFLGSRVVGDLKRIEKICERIGLSYKEIAERKKRTQIPDSAATAVSGDNGRTAEVMSKHVTSRTKQRKRATAGADKKTGRRRTRG
jgi:hypothetical protein